MNYLRTLKAGVCMIAASGFFVSPSANASDYPDKAAEREGAIRLAATSPWHLDVGDNHCRLARKFGDETTPSLLSIEQIAPGDRFDLIAASPALGKLAGRGWLYFGMRSDQKMETITTLRGETTGFGATQNIAQATLVGDPAKDARADDALRSAGIDLADAAIANRIVFREATTIISFETGGLAAPLKALNICAREMLQPLAVDAEAHDAFRPAIMPKQKSYFTRMQHEFAKAYGRKGRNALLRVRAVIETDGTVRDCFHEYTISSDPKDVDPCGDISAMQFEPATDKAGNAITSVFATSIGLWPWDPYAAGAHGGRGG